MPEIDRPSGEILTVSVIPVCCQVSVISCSLGSMQFHTPFADGKMSWGFLRQAKWPSFSKVTTPPMNHDQLPIAFSQPCGLTGWAAETAAGKKATAAGWVWAGAGFFKDGDESNERGQESDDGRQHSRQAGPEGF